MPDPCCSSPGNDEVFDRRTALRAAGLRRWPPLETDRRRRRTPGLHLTAHDRRLVEGVAAAAPVRGARVLDVGGGLGHLGAWLLLRRGAASSTTVELSPAYADVAAWFAAGLGLAGRLHHRTADATRLADVPRAEVVLLHPVVCCTDDWAGLLATTLAAGPRVVGLTLPSRHPLARVGMWLDDRWHQLRGRAFRMRRHDHGEVLERLRTAGFDVASDHEAVAWRTVVLTRGPGAGGSPSGGTAS